MAIPIESKPAPRPLPAVDAAPVEQFLRILELERKPGDTYVGYQIQRVVVQGDKVLKREMVGKPDMFEYAFTQAGELIDPRNRLETVA